MLDKGRILPSRLLVREIKQSEKTESGLIYKPVDIVKQRTHVGEVVLVGEHLPALNHGIQIGDKVLHSPNGFVTVEIDNESFRLLNAQDVLFIYR